MRSLIFCGFLLPVYVCVCLLSTPPALAGLYLSSTHGDTSVGVDRTSIPSAYSPGNCAHCHEQHMSIGGSEPAPTGGPSDFALFEDGYSSNTDNFCIECHDGSTTVASSAITNHSYSYRAGNLTSDFVSDIQDSFDTSGSLVSRHDLDDMETLLSGSIGTTWGFTSKSQPCEGCHNPHAVQGDPENSASGRKSSSARGYPVSRPSDYQAATGWELWGDESGEKMSDYVGALAYQAPYYGGSTSTYEPEGNSTSDGSNLTDFNTFCIDCHNGTNTTIWSTLLGRNLRTFTWSSEQHGAAAANIDGGRSELQTPYSDTNVGTYVTSCLDCHEPHGSTNIYLIRPYVNGGAVDLSTVSGADRDYTPWDNLCTRCHSSATDLRALHHAYLSSFNCIDCHYFTSNQGGKINGSDPKVRDCTTCHHHNSSASSYKTF